MLQRTLTTVFLLAICLCNGQELHSPPELLTELATYEEFTTSLLRKKIRTHLTKRSLPTLSLVEEAAAYLISVAIIEQLATKKMSRFIVWPLIALDMARAYTHYPLYKALEKYPGYDIAGIPSVSLAAGIAVMDCWQQVRAVAEKIIFNQHKNCAEIMLLARRNYEKITTTQIVFMHQQLLALKEDLLVEGLYQHLYLVGNSVQKEFDLIDHGNGDEHSFDPYTAHRLIILTQQLLNFVKPL